MANESCLDDSYVSPGISFSHYFPQSSSLNPVFAFTTTPSDKNLHRKGSKDESLNGHKINTSKGNSTDQEFSSLRERFLNREIIIPLKFKKKKNIPPPFSPPGEFPGADDVIDEDTNKVSNRLTIKTARNKT
ncbi:hypothetical protein OIU85_007994 [Salix viminalis]|uniref:Uncharacterized protein n=1 Tax=Salix viminalis TaxID=40686 RepID=A0A9Q0P9Y6_SALVM|nr:hypothetical protein OIU85_007994 [Salix viminalis]